MSRGRIRDTIGQQILQARLAKGMTQEELGSAIYKSPTTISRWETGKVEPSIEDAEYLDNTISTSLMSQPKYQSKSLPEYEIFVSTPMASIPEENFTNSHKEIRTIVNQIRQVCKCEVYWAGDEVTSSNSFEIPDEGTERNLNVLKTVKAYVFIYVGEVYPGSSGSLIELGIALGLKMPVTILVSKLSMLPYMIEEGFPRVAERTGFERVRIYQVESTNEALEYIRKYGEDLFF